MDKVRAVYMDSEKIGHDVEKIESRLLVSLITWAEYPDNVQDDILVAQCLAEALNTIPLNVASKIEAIHISRGGQSSKK